MSGGFTPGPWEASLEASRFVIQHVPEHGMGKRALAYTGGSEPANPFNARLIAAAPELYEALAAIERHCHARDLLDVRGMARAALAKAHPTPREGAPNEQR